MNSLTGARLHLRLELKFINKVISAIDCLFCTNKTQNHFHPNNHSCLAVCLSRKLIGVGIVAPPPPPISLTKTTSLILQRNKCMRILQRLALMCYPSCSARPRSCFNPTLLIILTNNNVFYQILRSSVQKRRRGGGVKSHHMIQP